MVLSFEHDNIMEVEEYVIGMHYNYLTISAT